MKNYKKIGGECTRMINQQFKIRRNQTQKQNRKKALYPGP